MLILTSAFASAIPSGDVMLIPAGFMNSKAQLRIDFSVSPNPVLAPSTLANSDNVLSISVTVRTISTWPASHIPDLAAPNNMAWLAFNCPASSLAKVPNSLPAPSPIAPPKLNTWTIGPIHNPSLAPDIAASARTPKVKGTTFTLPS